VGKINPTSAGNFCGDADNRMPQIRAQKQTLNNAAFSGLFARHMRQKQSQQAVFLHIN
jgi:hypothetical protein